MSAMASQISRLTIVYSTVYSGPIQRKHLTGEFSAQRASNTENASILWRHNGSLFSAGLSGAKLLHEQGGIDVLVLEARDRVGGRTWTRRVRRKIIKMRQNGRHFADDIFKCIFLNENVWISTTISLNFVPKGRININRYSIRVRVT